MKDYIAHVGVESPIEQSTEDNVSSVMEQFGFTKMYRAEGGRALRLSPWLYEGSSDEDERAIAVRLRSTLHAATGLELVVMVMQAERSQLAYTAGSIIGLKYLNAEDH